MEISPQHIEGVYVIQPHVISDERGGFFRTFCKKEMAELKMREPVQMNHSINHKKATLRGLHYQLAPHREQKLIRCISGSVFDVFVDLRENSPTFLQWGAVELSAVNKNMVFLDDGIAHGFITLEDNTELLYQHSEFYAPQFEAGIRFDDPKLAIEWPLNPEIVSERDLNHPTISSNFKGI